MIRAGVVCTAALTAACALEAAPPPVAPVEEIPVAPVGRPATAPAVVSAPVAAQAVAPWVARMERSEKTAAVAPCQITPVTASSVVTVEARRLGPGRLAVRVVQDDEAATGKAPPRSLLGRGYLFEQTAESLRVLDETGAAVAEDEAPRARVIALPLLDWPEETAAHPPAVGAEAIALEGPVAAVAALPLHGEPAEEAKATVKFAQTRAGDAGGGEEQVFDVTVRGASSSAGMCHRWSSEAEVKGELRVRASDGALLGLHLEGPERDTEGLCQDPSGKPGPPPPPHVCNKGTVVIEVRQPHVP